MFGLERVPPNERRVARVRVTMLPLKMTTTLHVLFMQPLLLMLLLL